MAGSKSVIDAASRSLFVVLKQKNIVETSITIVARKGYIQYNRAVINKKDVKVTASFEGRSLVTAKP